MFFRRFLSFSTARMGKKVLGIAFDGAEDIELTTTVDLLRRAGIDVVLSNLLDKETFTCARGTVITPDAMFKDVENNDYDAVFVPGGGGSLDNAENPRLGKILQRHDAAGKVVAAICAAPYIFTVHGIGKGLAITGYPSVKEKCEKNGYQFVEDKPVVVSKNIVTSRGPGTAMDFGLKLIEVLENKEAAQKVADALLYQMHQ